VAVVGGINLPYAFTMLFGRNAYGHPVSKGDLALRHGHPVRIFELDSRRLKLPEG